MLTAKCECNFGCSLTRFQHIIFLFFIPAREDLGVYFYTLFSIETCHLFQGNNYSIGIIINNIGTVKHAIPTHYIPFFLFLENEKTWAFIFTCGLLFSMCHLFQGNNYNIGIIIKYIGNYIKARTQSKHYENKTGCHPDKYKYFFILSEDQKIFNLSKDKKLYLFYRNVTIYSRLAEPTLASTFFFSTSKRFIYFREIIQLYEAQTI